MDKRRHRNSPLKKRQTSSDRGTQLKFDVSLAFRDGSDTYDCGHMYSGCTKFLVVTNLHVSGYFLLDYGATVLAAMCRE